MRRRSGGSKFRSGGRGGGLGQPKKERKGSKKNTPIRNMKRRNRRKTLGTSPHTKSFFLSSRRRGDLEQVSMMSSTLVGENGEEHPVFEDVHRIRRMRSSRRRQRRKERRESREYNRDEMLQAAMRATLSLSLKAGDFSNLPTELLRFMFVECEMMDAADLTRLLSTCRMFVGLSLPKKSDASKRISMLEHVAKRELSTKYPDWTVPWESENYRTLLYRAVTSQVYAIGGWSNHNKNLNVVECLSKQDDSWSHAMPMITDRRNFASTGVNGKIFVFGGEDKDMTLNSVEIMDPHSNDSFRRWTKSIPMKSPRCRLAVARRGHHIYVSGGLNEILEPVTTVVRFNARKQKWKPFCEMISARYSHASVVLRDTLYVIGGYDEHNICLKSMDCLRLKKWGEVNKEQASWKRCPPMQVCHGRLCSVIWRGKIVIADGRRNVEMYDPDTSEWIELPKLICRRRKYAMVVHNGKLLVIGGYNEDGFCLNTVETYDEASQCWVHSKPLKVARDALVAVY